MFSQRFFTLVFFSFVLFLGSAQTKSSVSSEENIFSAINRIDNSGSKIILYQPLGLQSLVDRHVQLNMKEGVSGYRIQINQWAGQYGREGASTAIIKFNQNFPEFDSKQVYTNYQAPYFKLRVGDLRNRHEAYELYHQVKKYFPNSYIVRSKINYPKLKEVNK